MPIRGVSSPSGGSVVVEFPSKLLGFRLPSVLVNRRQRQQVEGYQPDNRDDQREDPFTGHGGKYGRAFREPATTGNA